MIAAEEDEDMRLDAFIAKNSTLSRSRVQQLLAEECIKIKDEVVKKASFRIKAGQSIAVRLPAPVSYDVVAEEIDLDIVYEDSDLIVINKAPNMVVHPAPGHREGTMVNALLAHCQDLSGINGVMRPGIVHRLDKDTSGLIIVAKNDFAHAALSAQLKQHLVSREYLALVHGHMKCPSGTIKTLIGRHQQNRLEMAVLQEKGRIAITHYRVIEVFKDYSLLSVKLETGRTHQIRVHLAHLQHPIVGDPLYGRRREKIKVPNGQWLHATRIKFIHPRSQQMIELAAELPFARQRILNNLRRSEKVDN